MRRLNVLSNIVRRNLIFGGDQEPLVLAETLDADKNLASVRRWYANDPLVYADAEAETRPGGAVPERAHTAAWGLPRQGSPKGRRSKTAFDHEVPQRVRTSHGFAHRARERVRPPFVRNVDFAGVDDGRGHGGQVPDEHSPTKDSAGGAWEVREVGERGEEKS